MVAKRSFGEPPNNSKQQSCGEALNKFKQQSCAEAPNNSKQQQVDRDNETQPELTLENQSYDPDYLELWASEFETNSLFPDNRLPHEKPPNERKKTTEVAKFKIPLKRHCAAISPAVVHTVRANPFTRTGEQSDRKRIGHSGYLEHPLRSR